MAMDWSGYGAYAVPPLEEDDDDDEDFYGSEQVHINGNNDAQTAAGASAHSMTMSSTNSFPEPSATHANTNAPTTPSSEEQQRKEERQKQLETLRKKLLAKRGTNVRPDTPSKPPASIVARQPQQNIEQQEINAPLNNVNQHVNDDFGIESLLAEGKAAAEAKVARDKQAAVTALSLTVTDPTNTNQQTMAQTKPTNMDVTGRKPAVIVEKPAVPVEKPAGPLQPYISSPSKSANTKGKFDQPSSYPVKMSDPYYDDLAIWLQYTGYHDVPFRNSKLSTHKERRGLEQEAARIAERLEELEQAEKADLASLRATSAHPMAVTQTTPPPLPADMPAEGARDHTNALKRPRSPQPSTFQKSSRKTNGSASDFRIRGANEASTTPPRDNNDPLQRRENNTDRRRSLHERHERDPSLERRQQHYGPRDPPPPPRANGRGGHNQWGASREGPRPFNARDREWDRDGRPDSGFGTVDRAAGPQRGGNVDLDLRKGGVRYFMIKSWNHDNVVQAMQDGLWATQEKNESLLTEAFHSSRHVILLFSVNRSMAFQGYALMTSPPDPSLPTPTFCNKLNWATSPAFSLHWLATTPVHFRLVGHLKNTCNPDEEGLPRAVLVGKDGQEISQDAGMGVVWILDKAEEVEGRGRLKEERD